MANPFAAPLSPNPFAGAQKEAAKKVAQAKAKLPLPYSQTKAGQRATRGAESVNRTGLHIEQETQRHARETGNRRLGLPLSSKAAPSPQAKAAPPPASRHALLSLHSLTGLASDAGGAVGHAVEDAIARTYGTKGGGGSKGAFASGAAIATPINSTKIVEGLGTAAKNTPGSALRTITGTVPGLYATGKALTNLAEGHPKEAGQIAKSLLEVAKHPWASFQKEPVPIALMFAGGEGATGRLAGAAMRSGALGDRATQVASMDRVPLHLYGTHTGAATDQIDAGLHDVAIPRKYSPDVIRKGGQVAADTFKEKILHHDPNMATGEQANRYLYGGSLIGQHVAKGIPVGRLRIHAPVQGVIKPGLVDEQAAKGETLRRMYGGEAAEFVHNIKPKVGAEAVPLAVEGILRRPETVRADLQKELARLQAAAKGLRRGGPDVRTAMLTGKELRLNKANQKQIQGLLDDRKFLANPHPAFEAARQYADWSSPFEHRLVQLGHLEPDQINAKLVPYALSHMGRDVAYNENPGKHPLALAEKSSARQVKAAQKALERARGGTDRTALAAARERFTDARGAHHTAASDLQGLKAAGFIKANGDMYPRLERAGRILHPNEIKAHMRQELGDRGVGFLTHKQDQTYGKALESYAGKRPGTEVRSRTGVSFRHGTYDRSYEALRLQAYRHANAIAGHENRDEMLRRFGLGRFHTQEDAERAADNFAHTPEGERITKEHSLGTLTPHFIGPDRVIAQRNVETRALGPILRDFGLAEHKAINETADAPKYTILPEAVAARIKQHDDLNKSGQGKRLLQMYTNKWRSAALFTSPRWLLGNPQEHAIRLAMANLNPTVAIPGLMRTGRITPSVKLGEALINHWHGVVADQSRTEAERYVARAHAAAYSAGTHYGSIAVNAVHRTYSGPAGAFSGALDETGPTSKIVAAWDKWKGWIGQGMAKVEQNSKAAAVGKAALNETHKFTGEWRKLITRQDTAVRKFAEGKLSPNEASKLGNDVMEMMGNWSQLTPVVRNAVQTVSPFGLWWLTSMKFVFRTLPRDHPMKTAALAAMETGARTGEKEASAPSYLQGGLKVHLPIVGDVTLTPEYYSPFGVGVDPTKTAMDQILPQAEGLMQTAEGVNPLTKNKINAPPGILAGRALEEAITGIVPGARQAIQLAKKGGRPDETSLNPLATKPGTQRDWGEVLAKILSPVRYTPGKRESKSTGKKIKPGFGVPAGFGKPAGLGKPAGFGKRVGP